MDESDRLKNDKDVVMAAVQQCGEALRYATAWCEGSELWVLLPICGNKEIAMTGAANDGYILAYVSENLQDDEELVALAIRSNPSALRFASKRLQALFSKTR